MESNVEGVKLPRVAITYCTQCRWMLRAAYFGQELLSTFQTAIGEIALIPATGGLFQVTLTYTPEQLDETSGETQPRRVLLWDRKSEGGFPETKVLKQRVRDHIEPAKDLGHSDTAANKAKADEGKTEKEVSHTQVEAKPEATPGEANCEDCK